MIIIVLFNSKSSLAFLWYPHFYIKMLIIVIIIIIILVIIIIKIITIIRMAILFIINNASRCSLAS
jgi:hypothetical protein